MKKYNSEFKSMIVELYKTGRRVLELSREYGVSEVTIYKCIKQISPITSIDDADITLEEIKQLCEVLNVPRSTYYQLKHQTESKWKRENHQLLEQIKKIHFESSCRYGSIKVHRQLIKEGFSVSLKRVQR
ncbi:IS3 family transposase [Turicibacter sanguinis]|uniref:IS3 family transposase n=1 Tax=Turicibacter sanguinis TaxID=154288 RepID=A0A6G2CRD1_9FIRM|nr:IS3 family transposase [Turicibacter sanguinis]KAB3587349.1 IS3 family transposase [Phocaeicola vulgatus]MTK70812.1 IS3 family transposase [Turicibacter sanguinis]MTK81909.1 IS3 family transposase [Turicibacter sanguinis]MTK84233.1 IS3 family transposase [Turicibacter sanguinis]MTK86679.1 IS3 family transposase [Turicibacter sanguinis]